MAKKEVPVNHLEQFLPPGTGEAVLHYLHEYKVHLTIARERKSILGDYRHRTHQQNHRISVNGNLNPYAFLVTLLHEIAHLLTFEQYGNRVNAHGREWKSVFGKLLHQFVQNQVFPPDIQQELTESLKNPAASSCAEDGLLRVLRRYDAKKDNHHLIEEFPMGSLFRIKDGRVFRKGEKLRKRYKCTELPSGKVYLFSPVYEAVLVTVSS
ncbi:MAG TPA: SprT-like domain-containing protein [Chitinophagaceae bacterium]|nr:SprT-like domain-containing protein [Chitinophagaceae bacterium]HPH31374.1 SprT-like domain-containing protein [Chitinophagaceae bacterium]HPN57521.1 SprT-like domain-containing protein [Chitinophagaceae bacterium]